jgi:hypothetical protein
MWFLFVWTGYPAIFSIRSVILQVKSCIRPNTGTGYQKRPDYPAGYRYPVHLFFYTSKLSMYIPVPVPVQIKLQ